MRKVFKSILQGVGIILTSILVAAILRFFILDFYSIPSDSMTPAIEPGDFVVVNKLYFGARFYKNFDFLDGTTHPETTRVPGYSSLKRNDVIVFNFPTYYNDGSLDIDVETFYVKRCVALPGDTIAIVNGFYTVNGKHGYGNMTDQQHLRCFHGEYAPGIYNAFPFDHRLDWNIRDFGPLYIPKSGETRPINTTNYSMYCQVISHETHARVYSKEGKIYLGDSLIHEYTFHKNWYFMAGDKIFDSRDSRYIGPIPEDFIIGKVSFVLTSKDPYSKKYVWKRFFKKV